MLRALAAEMGVAVGEYMRPMDTVDDAGIAPGIARQAGVAGRIDLFRPYGLADCKTRPSQGS